MTERMRRTQIYLEPALSEALDRLARRQGTSRAELVREAARRFLAAEEPEEDPIWGIVGIGRGPSDGRGSLDHDRILAEFQLKEMADFRKHQR